VATPELEGIQAFFSETPVFLGMEASFVQTPVFRGMEAFFAQTPELLGMEAFFVEAPVITGVFPAFVHAVPANAAKLLIFRGFMLDSGNLALNLTLAGHPTLTLDSPTVLDSQTATAILNADGADLGRYDVEATTDLGEGTLPEGFAIKAKPRMVGCVRGRR